MLQPGERILLHRALEPPEGYRLDYAIGTTFSLDLVALLTAPLAFTMFDRRADDEEQREESLELLESLRRYANSIALFCQAGRIAFPRARYPQFAWLERTVIQCRVQNGLFHPKVWVLRYTTRAGGVRYRVLCLSRNLTLANSWDTLLALEGEAGSQHAGEVESGPLADFVSALPGFSSDLPEATEARVRQIAGELRQVAFAPPPGFDSIRFHPLGIPGYSGWPFPARGSRALVISPFLSPSTVERIAEGFTAFVLISTPDALAELSVPSGSFNRFWTLDDDALAELPPGADVDDAVSREELVQLTGLHAKTYVFERGRQAEVWTGSANATDPAFERNVEFLVQLTGSRDQIGIDTLMQRSKDGSRLIDILEDAQKLVGSARPDEVQDGLEARIESVRSWLVSLDLEARVGESESHYDLVLYAISATAAGAPPGATVTCWPVMVGEALARRLGDGPEVARFERLSIEGLSAFIAFKVVVRDRQAEREARFVLNLPLVGAPADREDKLLRALIGDRARLTRFLTLLLSDDGSPPEDAFPPLAPGTGPAGSADSRQGESANGMLELLIRTLDRAPERLDEVAKLLQKFEGAEDREALFPEHFDSIWQPIWQARGRITSCAKT